MDERNSFRDANPGAIDNLHEEDIVFDFRGDRPGQLTPNRYYRGTVDGFADFGVFVDLAEGVTGLLHQSEIPGRLENLDWEAGDEVFVQVTGIQENGNVDLGWSIRQSMQEFRGHLVDDPERGDVEAEPEGGADRATGGSGNEQSGADAAPDDVTVADLADHEDEAVRLAGEVTGVRQTGGPTLFTLADGTGEVTAAAFVGAGERAYPDVGDGDLVAVEGVVERHQGDLQVETDDVTPLEGDERADVADRLDDARESEAAPSETDLLVEDSPVAAVHDGLVNAATAIRRAVAEERPVVVRHPATVDGYVAGAAIERAVIPLVRAAHDEREAEYHLVSRRPLRDEPYDVGPATDDVTSLTRAADRHDESAPLFVFAGTGGVPEAADGIDLLATYGADAVVLDAEAADHGVAAAAEVVVGDVPGVTSAALAANVAAMVDPDVREDVAHLPAVSFWEDTPTEYVDLAAAAGYDEDFVTELREAVALEAYYQIHDDKRELVADLFWSPDNRGLAGHVSEQFRDKLETELDTVRPHLERRESGDLSVAVLDTDSFSHERSFPPVDLLLDVLHREERDAADGPVLTVALGEDTLRFRSTHALDRRAVGRRVAEAVPEASVIPRGGREGHLRFVMGERRAVLDATVEDVAAQVEPPAA